jgi:hypothetical protein
MAQTNCSDRNTDECLYSAGLSQYSPEAQIIFLTRHAQMRMDSRRISSEALAAVLIYGRKVWARGAQIHALGKKEVLWGARHGLDLRSFAGLQVVCTPGGAILTAYRNHDFRTLRKLA